MTDFKDEITARQTDKVSNPTTKVSPAIDVSIVIVSWNAKAFLLGCLASLADRNTLATEIIVVDNASSDGSPEAVRAQFPQVKLIQNEDNLGFAKANNIGLAQCSGNYIALINSDVVVKESCLETLVNHMQQNPRLGLTGPQIVGAKGEIQRSCMRFPGFWNHFCRAVALDALFPRSRLFAGFLMGDFPHESARQVDILNGCFWLVRREALDAVGRLDEAFFIYGEDMDWCRRFWLKGWYVEFVAEARAIHFGGASSANAPTRFYIEQRKANMKYWEKHHKRFGRAAFWFLQSLHEVVRITGFAMAWLFRLTSSPEAKNKIARSKACLRWLMSA